MPTRANSGKVARERGAAVRAVANAVGDWAVGGGPLFRQLARAIAGSIERGELARGTRLPAERALAEALVVSRGTAVAAYDLLVADGLVERLRGSGTYVLGPVDLGLPPGREGSALVHRLVDRSAGPTEVVDLSISVLRDADALPAMRLSTAELAAVVPDTGYSPWGLGGLRAAVAEHVSGWGLPTSPSQVVITTGAQQAVSAAAACWLRPGDAVVVEDPTYPGAVAAFAQAGAVLVGVPVDRHGVRVEPLAAAIASSQPALVYLQPTLHSPTGSVLSESRRPRIAEIVRAARVPLLEDMALADLAWDRRPGSLPAPVAAWCADAAVAVVGSLSKLFWGGLRIGFVRAPEPIAVRFARVKATHDLGTSAVSQVLGERLLRAAGEGSVQARHDALRARYEVLASALRRELPSWSWPEPAGGLSLWARLPGGADGEAFAQAALRHGVAVAAAPALSPSAAYRDHVRLSFSSPPDELDEGVRRLAAAWRSA